MEGYIKLALMTSLCVVSCQGQLYDPTVEKQLYDLNMDKLHNRVRELEGTVIQLVTQLQEMQGIQTDSRKGTKQTSGKRGFMFPGVTYNSENGLLALEPMPRPDAEVGFYVSLMSEAGATLSFDTTLLFDNIQTNIGDAYDRTTGIFTCPLSGTYMFSLNLACAEGSYLEASIVKNNVDQVFKAICDHRKRKSADGYYLYCGSTQNGGTAILSLTRGEKITVKKVWPSFGQSRAAGNGHTTFSGYLLRPS